MRDKNNHIIYHRCSVEFSLVSVFVVARPGKTDGAVTHSISSIFKELFKIKIKMIQLKLPSPTFFCCCFNHELFKFIFQIYIKNNITR